MNIYIEANKGDMDNKLIHSIAKYFEQCQMLQKIKSNVDERILKCFFG